MFPGCFGLYRAPKELPKFFEALASGQAEFVNGVRLVYPMYDKAMRFLNMCEQTPRAGVRLAAFTACFA